MSALQRLPVPAPPEVPVGPWRIKWTRPNGESGLNARNFEERSEADYWCDLCRRHCNEGCTYDVVPDRP